LVGESWEVINEKIWHKLDNENDKYFFKKSHGIAFGVLVILHAQLISKHLGGAEEYFI
jgi:hypothetical protein